MKTVDIRSQTSKSYLIKEEVKSQAQELDGIVNGTSVLIIFCPEELDVGFSLLHRKYSSCIVREVIEVRDSRGVFEDPSFGKRSRWTVLVDFQYKMILTKVVTKKQKGWK